jgi:putative redox protein
MNTAKVIYLQNLRTESTHIRSGKTLITDAPLDNKGKGEAFSPTDLLCTALATCMITTMAIAADNYKIKFSNATAEVVKVMESNPRRVSEIKIEITIVGIFSDEQKVVLERAALNCPVTKSLHHDLNQNVNFKYLQIG